MTVTDTTTNQYWSGSGTAGPEDLTSWYLAIAVYTPTVDGTSNLDVCVGEKIPLMARYGPSDMTLKWTVQGSIIAGYTTVNSGPTMNDIDYTKPSTAKIDPVTTADLAEPALTYYWMDTDSGSTENEKVTFGTLPDGQSPPSASTTFNVYRPSPSYTTSYPGPITLVDPDVYDGQDPNGTGPGIKFSFSISTTASTAPFGTTANLSTVQIVGLWTITTEQYNSDTGTTTNFETTLPFAKLPGPLLDTTFPYGGYHNGVDASGNPYIWTSDAPHYPVDPPPAGSGFNAGTWSTQNVVISEEFDHELLFLPEMDGSIYAPLSQVAWGWTAEADNHWYGFSLTNSAKVPSTPPTSINLSTLPEWNSNVFATSWGINDPDWFVAP